jgi:hypothetical protein
MAGPFRGVPYSFGALLKTFGLLWIRCDVCRRYARLFVRELRDVDYRTKTFSCGADGAIALEEPCKDTGMKDYRLDQRVDLKHHPTAIKRPNRLVKRIATLAVSCQNGRSTEGAKARDSVDRFSGDGGSRRCALARRRWHLRAAITVQ